MDKCFKVSSVIETIQQYQKQSYTLVYKEIEKFQVDFSFCSQGFFSEKLTKIAKELDRFFCCLVRGGSVR